MKIYVSIQSGAGSYLITSFVDKTLETLDKPFIKQSHLIEIFDEIQNELEKTKQLPICIYNNDTRFIKFKPHICAINNIEEEGKYETDMNNDIEMLEMEIKNNDTIKTLDMIDTTDTTDMKDQGTDPQII